MSAGTPSPQGPLLGTLDLRLVPLPLDGHSRTSTSCLGQQDSSVVSLRVDLRIGSYPMAAVCPALIHPPETKIPGRRVLPPKQRSHWSIQGCLPHLKKPFPRCPSTLGGRDDAPPDEPGPGRGRLLMPEDQGCPCRTVGERPAG